MNEAELTAVRGVGRITAAKLESAGIRSVRDLAQTPVGRIAEISGFPETRSAAIRVAAVQWIEEMPVAMTPGKAVDGKKGDKKPKKGKKTKKKKKKGKDKKKKKKKKKESRKKGRT
jgi:predicted RecB family nuclease